MRQLLTFSCEGETLGASLDLGRGEVGVLMVTGGSQTRIGSHRMYERLAKSLAERGFSCFRFDRRGVGDSSGDDPGFRDSGPDIAAAAADFRQAAPNVRRMVGLGLCDGATALALQGAGAGFECLILINPWLVEAEADAPPPAAIKRHYINRLTSREGWKKLLTGAISAPKLIRGLKSLAAARAGSLSQEVARSLSHHAPCACILATGDATAIAAEAEWRKPSFAASRSDPILIESDSHTFAKPGDEEALLGAVLEALERLELGKPQSRSSRA